MHVTYFSVLKFFAGLTAILLAKRHNAIGALNGSPERVRQWREAAPGRFIPALRFQVGVRLRLSRFLRGPAGHGNKAPRRSRCPLHVRERVL